MAMSPPGDTAPPKNCDTPRLFARLSEPVAHPARGSGGLHRPGGARVGGQVDTLVSSHPYPVRIEGIIIHVACPLGHIEDDIPVRSPIDGPVYSRRCCGQYGSARRGMVRELSDVVILG